MVTGNQGSFPAALGTKAPTRVTHLPHRPAALVHGLAIDTTDTGLRALNARTGDEYWRCERRDRGAGRPSVGASGDTVVAWFEDGKVVAVDVRTGNVRWRANLSRGGSPWAEVHVGAGQAVVQSSRDVVSFSERSGKERWKLKPSRFCEGAFPREIRDFAEHLTGIEMGCAKDSYSSLLVGVDNRTGAELWKRNVPAQPEQADSHTLVMEEADRIQIREVDRKSSRRRALIPDRSFSLDGAGDGVILCSKQLESPGNAGANALTGYDARAGKRLWGRQAGAGHSFGLAKIADGRVYVVRNSLIPTGDPRRVLHADLLVLDAHSGDLLHTMRLPTMKVPRGERVTDLWVHEADDGAVLLGWIVGPDALAVS